MMTRCSCDALDHVWLASKYTVDEVPIMVWQYFKDIITDIAQSHSKIIRQSSQYRCHVPKTVTHVYHSLAITKLRDKEEYSKCDWACKTGHVSTYNFTNFFKL